MEIFFDVVDPAAVAGEYASEADPSPYIHLADPNKDIENMKNADEIVIPDIDITLDIDYPLSRTFEFNLRAPDPTGWSRARLVKAVSLIYQQIYNEEDRTSENIADYIPGSLNRNRTEGIFGIFGHVLEDLLLHCVKKKPSNGHYELWIDS